MKRLTDEELTEAFSYAHGSLRLTAALSELKERRAADLSAEDREALEWVRTTLALGVQYGAVADPQAMGNRALSVIAAILNARGEK